MHFSLFPREMKFFDMFDEVAALLTRAAGKFLALVTQFDHVTDRANELRQEEHACDEIVGRIITALDRTFITPFDREDIHALASSLDDVMDSLEETAHRFAAFRVGTPTPAAVALARLIQQCCEHLEKAVRLCSNMKNADSIYALVREIGQMENEADNIYRESDGALFADPPDMLTLIKWRELYDWLEATVDAAQDVANVISGIVIKAS